MAYKALYRQFRPRRFADLKGQDMIARVLKNQIMAGEPAHAYLFSGPRGTGKTSTAKILAMALNCLHPEDGEPCLTCENCRAALSDAMIDIIEMDAASNNGVDNARDIRDKAGLLPTRGKSKVYIIDEVHMLTGQAFNALLKTLEEPPAHVVFILATTELDALPKTVLSRCLRFDFKFIDRREVVERMQEVLRATGGEAEEEALYEIAEASEGAMRDALTILEKCCAFGVRVDRDIVASVLGRASGEAMHRFWAAFLDYAEGEALLGMREILDSGIECGAVTAQILHIYEQMLFCKVAGEQNAWAAEAARMSKEAILRGMEVFSEAQTRMRYAPRPEILLEAAILRAMQPLAEPGGEDALWREEAGRIENKLAALARRVAAGVPVAAQTAPGAAGGQEATEAAPQEGAAPEAAAQGTQEAPVAKRADTPAEGRRTIEPARQATSSASVAEPEESFWAWVCESYADDPGAQPMLRALTLTGEDANTIYLQASSSLFAMMAESEQRRREMQQKMQAKFGRYKNIRVTLREAAEQLPEEDIIDIID